MMDYILAFALIMAYIIAGYFITKFIRARIVTVNPYKRLVMLSFIYSMIFGIGLAGGGGDPGFALPFPIILSGIFDLCLWVEWRIFVRGFLVPLLFWWIVIFVVMIVRDLLEDKFRKQMK